MGKINSTALKVIKKITEVSVEKNFDEWPPFCVGIYHQPKRPKAENKGEK